MPTFFAPSSVQQKFQFFRLRKYFPKRKAWLFSHDKVGAQASANLFSLVTTARVNNVEPFAYPSYLFERLPTASTVEELEAPLPWNAKAALPS